MTIYRSKNVAAEGHRRMLIHQCSAAGICSFQKRTIPELTCYTDPVRVAIYARISTKDKGQEYENQVRNLRAYIAARKKEGWRLAHEYLDLASGKNSDRRQFGRLFEDAARRKFDLVLFWSLDRFSREGVLETLQYLQRLTTSGVDYKSYTEQYLDSCGVFRDAVLSILATIAKQERIRIRERTIAGLERARAEGKRLGRPKLVIDRQRILGLRKKGKSLTEISRALGIAKTSVHRVLSQRTADESH